jgi:XTP/dITP diphosphohydrolase
MQLLFATSNPNKVRELSLVLEPLGIEVLDLSGFANVEEPEEDGATFADNARLKARSYAAQTGVTCLAEDSGLEVDALDGAPGVHSARYSGLPGPRGVVDPANNEKLLAALENVPWEKRQARFVCTMCIAKPNGEVVAETRGEFEGRITFEPAGQNGFGYDPLFFVEEAGCTSAELSNDEKSRRSHRGQAARLLVQRLQALSDLG